MDTDWRKLGLFLIGVGGLYIVFVGIAANFAQVLSLKHGVRLLVLLFIAALGYRVWEAMRGFWRNHRALQAKLEEARDFIMRSAGDSSGSVLLCAQTLWLFRQPEQFVRVSELRADGLVTLDVSHVSLEPGNLLGMHFRIMSSDKERARGTVQSCDPTQACVELYEQTENLSAGDLAIPIVPPEATDLERLLGNILFIVSE
jgi:hypothetical protein